MLDFHRLAQSKFFKLNCFFYYRISWGFRLQICFEEKMPSETDTMGSVFKEEEDTEKSNEQSVSLMTLNSENKDSIVSAKHIDTHLTNANGDKVSTSDVRTKFLNSTEDAVSTSDNFVTTINVLEAENLYPQSKTTGNVNIKFVNNFNYSYF